MCVLLGVFSLSTFIFFPFVLLFVCSLFLFLFFLFSPLLFFVCFVFSCFFCFVLLFISFFSLKFSVFVSPVSMVVRCRANRYTIRGVCVLRGRAADQNAFARRKPRCFFHFTHQTTFLFYFCIFFCKTGVFYRSSSSLRRKLFSNWCSHILAWSWVLARDEVTKHAIKTLKSVSMEDNKQAPIRNNTRTAAPVLKGTAIPPWPTTVYYLPSWIGSDDTLPDTRCLVRSFGINIFCFAILFSFFLLPQSSSGVVQTVTQFAAFVSCGVGRPTRRLRPDGKPAVMEEVDGFLGADDLPENAALSEQLVKSVDTDLIAVSYTHLTLPTKA